MPIIYNRTTNILVYPQFDTEYKLCIATEIPGGVWEHSKILIHFAIISLELDISSGGLVSLRIFQCAFKFTFH